MKNALLESFFIWYFVIYLSCEWVIITLCLHYIITCIDKFVCSIPVSTFIIMYMLYNILIGCTSYWVLFLYISFAWVILPLYCHYICVHIHMFVNVGYMFTLMCLCPSYDILLVCTPYWEACHTYFLYIICYAAVSILVDLNPLSPSALT